MINTKHHYLMDEINKQGHFAYNLDGVWHVSDKEAVQSIIDNYDPLPDARAESIQRINEQSQSYMQAIEDEYPEFEKRTWATQQREIEVWEIDNSSPTPRLDIIASNRGIDRELLLIKTLNKVKAYNDTAAALAGKRQALEDKILASDNIDWIVNAKFELTNG